ncbi:MAG TPA: nucleoside deaminase [Acidimicrobiales bacterium]
MERLSGSFLPVDFAGPFLDDETAMDEALLYAAKGLSSGDVAVGALVLDGSGRVLAARHDEVRSSGDPTAHAAALALRDTAAARGSWRLLNFQLIVTREPCALCAGAAVSARIGRAVVGARDERHGCLGSRYNLGADPRLNHEFDVSADVLADRCEAIFSSSFLNDTDRAARAA